MIFKPIGRICVRSENVCGLFIPFNSDTSPLKSGIYEIREVLGELIIVSIGKPATSEAMYESLSLEEMVEELPYSAMTKEEIQSERKRRNGR